MLRRLRKSISAAADRQIIAANLMTARKIVPENLIIAHW
jgi:hypothetical protein